MINSEVSSKPAKLSGAVIDQTPFSSVSPQSHSKSCWLGTKQTLTLVMIVLVPGSTAVPIQVGRRRLRSKLEAVLPAGTEVATPLAFTTIGPIFELEPKVDEPQGWRAIKK